MKRKFAAVTALFIAAVMLCSCGKTVDTLRLGTGNTGGIYYTYGSMIGELYGSGMSVKSTAGSQANMRLMKEGFVDLAIVQSDVLSEAVNGTGDFQDEPVECVRAVAGLYTEAFQIVVHADSDINSISDLQGKRVSVGDEGSGVAKNAEYLLRSAGLKSTDIVPAYMTYSESAAALESNDIDAFFVILGTPSTVITELAESTDVRIISIDERTISYMTNLYQGYYETTIPSGTYKGQDTDISTIGVKAVLTANSDIDPMQIEAITAMLFEKGSSIRYTVPVSEPDVDFAVSDIPCSFHSGAAEYYKSIGVTVNSDNENGSGGYVFGAQDQ